MKKIGFKIVGVTPKTIMKLSLLVLFLFSFSAYSQTKKELIENGPLDSVLVFVGGESILEGPALYIKFSGNPQLFFNELAKLHTYEAAQVDRTENRLTVPETTKPYWVYGTYSVHAQIFPKEDYSLIEVYFLAYANPSNYRIYGSEQAYQKIINELLKK